MSKRVIKVRDPDMWTCLHPALDGSLCDVLQAYMAEDDNERGWPVGSFIRTSMIVSMTNGLEVGSFVETANTIYEIVE